MTNKAKSKIVTIIMKLIARKLIEVIDFYFFNLGKLTMRILGKNVNLLIWGNM